MSTTKPRTICSSPLAAKVSLCGSGPPVSYLERLHYRLRHVFHNESLQLGERARHVEERQDRFPAYAHFKAALARLLWVDGHLGARGRGQYELLQLRRPRLECASALASLDDHVFASASARLGSGLSRGLSFLRWRGISRSSAFGSLLRRHFIDACVSSHCVSPDSKMTPQQKQGRRRYFLLYFF